MLSNSGTQFCVTSEMDMDLFIVRGHRIPDNMNPKGECFAGREQEKIERGHESILESRKSGIF